MTAEKKVAPPKPQAATSRVSLFYGIAIEMVCGHYGLPHFYAGYQGQEAKIGLDNTLLAGSIPAAALERVREWASLHQAELQDAWARCRRGEYPLPIPALHRDKSLVGPGHLYLTDAVAAEALDGYRIRVAFADGVCGEVDLSQLAGRGVFKAWHNRAFFENVFVSGGVVSWPGELDLDPCQLYIEVTGKAVEEIIPGLRPGYRDA